MYLNVAQPFRVSARRACARRARGFSLVEVMVALVVSAIGLLGLAKMESLALSSTSVAGSRSIAAIEASSLAAAMHANPGYWAGGFAPATTIVSAANNFAAAPACLTAGAGSCIPSAMAFYDLQQWAISLAAVLPGYLATITCSTAGFPVTCTIQIQWTENSVAANAKQTNIGALAQPTYVLYVQP
ncbi:MAG TPA: type IV pilus modification protein PilV [Steroidobacteraceae bacterium]|nr:type IV pilus modification protein PilV [Steroidobacteraceae bacterium]